MFFNRKFQIYLCIFVGFIAFCSKKQFVFQAATILNFEIKKCPFCFAFSFCNHLKKIKINFTIAELILGVLNNKYVFYGNYENKKIAIKRLVSIQELHVLDNQVFNLINSNFEENKLKYNNRTSDFYLESALLLNRSFTDPSYKIKLCPSLHNVNNFFDAIFENNQNETYSFIHIWTSLFLNPEPLILQVFKSNNGWPVPEYLGCCGRIELVEYCGKPLSSYIYYPWLVRVHIFEQLLWMAHNFTFKNPDFAVYLRDVSFDNIVLGPDLNIRIVDLEHIILLDKNTREADQPSTWSSIHVSEHHNCENCLVYSPMEICSYHISDHNFYVICKEFLSSIFPNDLGFLHSVPNLIYIDSKINELKFYVNECIHPSNNKSRFEIASNLRKLLQDLKMNGNFSIEKHKHLI